MVILVPYVGQLLEVRRELQRSNLRVYVSGRDQEEIDKQQEGEQID